MKEYGVIIDLDGTLIHKGKATTGARELIEYLKIEKIPFRVITNSVSRTLAELSATSSMVGLKIDDSLFLNPIIALNRFLEDNAIESYYFVGPSKVGESLTVTSRFDECPEYIVLSGMEEVDYSLLNKLFGYIKQGAKLLTMSRSEFYITENSPMLDTGAFTRMLEYHAECEAVLFGKPSGELFTAAIKGMGLNSSTVMVIGDDVLTDIKGAKEFGLSSVLVRTGKYQKDDELIEEPYLVVNNLLEVIDAIYTILSRASARTFS